MIQANELRVGNLLKAWFNTNNGFEQTVIEISPMVIDEIYHGVTDYEPIPITEEWLLRFGFIKDPYMDYVYEKDGTEFRLLNAQCDLIINSVGVSVSFNSIHQLQNIYFAITGEELKMKDK
jgi:hypothetical protein